MTGEVAFLDFAIQGLREQKLNIPYAMSELWSLLTLRQDSGVDSEIEQKTFDGSWTQYTRIVEQLQNARPPIGLGQGESHGNDRRAVVITEQLLDVGHAPTRIALEATKSLSRNHDMQVLLVNTAQYQRSCWLHFESRRPSKQGIVSDIERTRGSVNHCFSQLMMDLVTKLWSA